MPPPNASRRSRSSQTRSAKLSDAQTTWNDARSRTKDALQSLREHDAALAAHTEQVNRATVRHEAAVAECERLEAGLLRRRPRSRMPRGRPASPTTPSRVPSRLPVPSSTPPRATVCSTLWRVRATARCARLDVETLRERVRRKGRVDQLVRQRERERAAAAEAARRAVIRRAQRALAAEVADALPPVLDSVDRSVTQARVSFSSPSRHAPR
jgi:chromosome segregation protein